VLLRNAQQRQPGLDHVPRPDAWRHAALHAHGTDEQKATYLQEDDHRRMDGHHVPDRAALRYRPGPDAHQGRAQPDGTYRITGQKIFISAGEHDMAGNIIHLVLARVTDAPPGIKGVSLFIVPKFLVNKDGSLGERNGIYCGGLEHKMGIHGNATCQMVLDGAVGTMVGQPNKGMQGMFVMMNAARLGVGNQSLGLTEVAYQNALAYAKDRIQMRSLSGPKAKDKPADPIIVHPDVRKMLLTAKAYAEGGRALAMFCALLLDKVHYHPMKRCARTATKCCRCSRPSSRPS
jgi:alkylation response protein AidB-like acyl-CoA dehydrogenase